MAKYIANPNKTRPVETGENIFFLHDFPKNDTFTVEDHKWILQTLYFQKM